MTSNDNDDTCLLGSSKQPSNFILKDGTEACLGDIVLHAFARSGLKTAREWNALPEDEMEKRIDEVVKEMT